jgi:hypothetical protein
MSAAALPAAAPVAGEGWVAAFEAALLAWADALAREVQGATAAAPLGGELVGGAPISSPRPSSDGGRGVEISRGRLSGTTPVDSRA